LNLDAQRAECQVLSFGAQFFLAQRAECQGLSLLALPVQENKKNWHCAQRLECQVRRLLAFLVQKYKH
jgi:hypothetical protein